jgi:hypothetical protein
VVGRGVAHRMAGRASRGLRLRGVPGAKEGVAVAVHGQVLSSQGAKAPLGLAPASRAPGHAMPPLAERGRATPQGHA